MKMIQKAIKTASGADVIGSLLYLFSCFSIAHLEDVQNQTIIFHNYSTILCKGVSIIPPDREHASLLWQVSWTFLQEGTQLHCLVGLSALSGFHKHTGMYAHA